MPNSHSNFVFLKVHDPIFFQLASSAEQSFNSDPNTTLIKLRQLGEALAQDIAARCGIDFKEMSQAELLFALNQSIKLDPSVRELFHSLRIEGNKATHAFVTKHKEAFNGLQMARSLAIWFHQSFGKDAANFKAGPFIAPPDPSEHLRKLTSDIETLRAQLTQTHDALKTNQQLAELIQREKQEYSALAEHMDVEARSFEQQAKQHEAELVLQRQAFETRIAALQSAILHAPKDSVETREQITRKTQRASHYLELTEAQTRILIDQQLIQAGWEADTQNLKYSKGARPEKGKNKAIAEWPVAGKQSADYVLFIGLDPVAVVEAKRENTNVQGKLEQAKRYADGLKNISFIYSSNGKPYLAQLKSESGTWFRDIRKPTNIDTALQSFHTPDGLLNKLRLSQEAAEKQLEQEPFEYLKLRDYQIKAIHAVEAAFANNQTSCLLEMATGTGKTRTIVGLMHRFLKSERFKRILFLVDRTALGEQAIDTFKEMPLEQSKTLAEIYNIIELKQRGIDTVSSIQVATVQAMVQRIFMSDNPPPIDQFDCIIVDEAHRGYTLDQEQTIGELVNRDSSQYLSSYRRVLEYFDASKIALTATPAQHTTEIFGRAVYTYSYREAVADDWLIDHEDPIRYETVLSQNGIDFEKGESVDSINIYTGRVENKVLEDELHFDVDAFNKRVITESFNRVICEQLVQELDPFGEQKTLIFCATDKHADMIKSLLDEAFKTLYPDVYKEAAVRKITGQSDQPTALIKRYKNEAYPNIAITVDLLSTGIDVPKICNIVFLRRVKSRVLYEQMMGRATRRCDEIGKVLFKIFDPVGIYKLFQSVSEMKPLVKDPNITLAQLVGELVDPNALEQALNTPGEAVGTTHADDVLNDLNQKIMRILRKAHAKAENNEDVKTALGELEQIWGIAPEKLHQHLHEIGPKEAAVFLKDQVNLVKDLEHVKTLVNTEYNPIVSLHEDTFLKREQSYGDYARPGDYIESFNQFIRDNVNQSAALHAVVNRPKDLTRADLKAVRLMLDQHGYRESVLDQAWKTTSNQNIAASIIGYIRQAALGEALIPFNERVQKAMQRIYNSHNWTIPQRTWLERLARQMEHESILDHEFINKCFANQGGVKHAEIVFKQQFNGVLEQLNEYLWVG